MVVDKVALVNISGAGIVSTIGVAARAFTAPVEVGVNIIMISKDSSQHNISFVVTYIPQVYFENKSFF
jgi:aspartate kinase